MATVPSHYSKVPKSYHKAWFYEKNSPFEKWQLALISKELSRSVPSDGRLGDLGGGTGRFASLLHAELKLPEKVLCVDNSADMLKYAGGLEGVETLCQDVVDFATNLKENTFGGFLLKEVIHHVPEDRLGDLFSDLLNGLRPKGTCLIVTRPKREIAYPFFEAAKTVWMNGQPDSAIFTKAMEDVGFVAVSATLHDFPVTMPLEQWIDMVNDRMWSTFSEENFSQAELDKGIAEIRSKWIPDTGGNIHFSERMVFVRGEKKH